MALMKPIGQPSRLLAKKKGNSAEGRFNVGVMVNKPGTLCWIWTNVGGGSGTGKKAIWWRNKIAICL